MKNNFSITFRIWLRAQGFYLLLNLVALAIPPIFFVSEAYAIIAGIPACVVFAFGYHLVMRYCHFKMVLVAAICGIAAIITFGATLVAAWHFSPGNVWHEWTGNYIFPVAGIGCAIVSTLTFSKTIKADFQPSKNK